MNNCGHKHIKANVTTDYIPLYKLYNHSAIWPYSLRLNKLSIWSQVDGGGNGNPLRDSRLENSMDRGA